MAFVHGTPHPAQILQLLNSEFAVDGFEFAVGVAIGDAKFAFESLICSLAVPLFVPTLLALFEPLFALTFAYFLYFGSFFFIVKND